MSERSNLAYRPTPMCMYAKAQYNNVNKKLKRANLKHENSQVIMPMRHC